MNSKIKEIINLIVLIIIAIIVTIAVKSIPDFMLVQEAKVQNILKIGNKLLAETPEMPDGALFPLDEAHAKKEGEYWRFSIPGTENGYCAEKGAHFTRHGNTYKMLYEYVKANMDFSSEHGCGLPGYMDTIAYYRQTSSRKANYGEAYAVTYPAPGWNDWSAEKQEAIWDMDSISDNIKDPSDSNSGASGGAKITAEASAYQAFMDKIVANGKKIVKGDKTNQSDVKKNVLQDTKEYIVGPFVIDYIEGKTDTVAFGGISDMYIVGKNTGRIEISEFITAGSPKYFTPQDDVHCVDYNAQNYPKPNEEFWVKYSATSDEQIDKLYVEFKWMETEATLKYYEGYRYKTAFVCEHKYHCDEHEVSCETAGCEDPDCPGGHTQKCTLENCCYSCKIKKADSDTPKNFIAEFDSGYQKLLSTEGTRWLNVEKLEIPIPETPDEEENLHITLAGHVWEDEDMGKESLPNGTKDSTEKYKAGVEVILHDAADGTIVTTNGDGETVKNPVVTKEDGYYEFKDLDSKKKYYIEFKYDGQLYEATVYKSEFNGNEEGRLAGNISNALENNREAYNNQFAEIGSAPASYKIGNRTNTAWIIAKTSKETPYGIKEIYDEVINTAISSQSYSAAYAKVKAKYSGDKDITSKLQFIEDCRISSYTNVAGNGQGKYPIWDNFLEDTEGQTVGGVYFHPLIPTHRQIDFGLHRRQEFDLALRKDVEKVTVEINGKVHTYTYDTRNAADETDDGTWDINIRLSDAYYNTKYSREIFASDYQYKASNYGDNSAAYGKTKEDELNVYVTYKLTVRNQSQSILGEVMEIVDYYDEDFEYVDERSYIEIKNGIRQTDSGYKEAISQGLAVAQTNQPVKATTSSRYGSGNETTISGYDKLYIQGLQGKKLSSGQTAYIYLTFKVKKDNINNEDWIRLDEQVESAEAIGVGKENIAEINGFKTYYRNGTQIPNFGTVSGYSKVAGLFDVDSVPGNINPNDVPKDGNINYDNFEDDTDKAPNIRLILYRENGELVVRSIDGIVWEDERTEINNDQHTAVADGIKQNNEESINGVTVQLVELMDNGTEYIWKQFSSGQGSYDAIININNMIGNTVNDIRGGYVFKSYMPGNYVVRFIYGDTVKTVLPNTSTEVTNAFGQSGQNAKSYNGQDYKSTTYQEGITQNKEYVWREDSTWNNGIETLGKELTRVQTFKADCSNNETANATVPANAQQGYLYDITASDVNANVSDAKDIMTDNNLNNPYYRQNATLNSREDVIGYSDVNVTNYIAEVLASHEKLPLNKVELNSKLEELMKETQMTAETGLINVELEYDRNATGNQVESNPTSYKIQNVSLGLEERPKAQLAINKEVTNVKLTLADGSTLFDATDKATNVLWRDHKAYSFDKNDFKLQADPMTQIRERNLYDVKYGLIQLSMDEELMHGATIKVSYKITVTNEGEVDYKDNQFYYTGIVANKNTVVKTIANQVIDYVANNFQFYAVDNSSWQVISQEELLNGLVNMTLANETAKYNTVITTSASSNIANTLLVPTLYGSGVNSVSDDLILTQLITSENETDDLTYRNIVEIVKTSNDVGRRNAYSVVGNQNPTEEPAEVDSDRAEIIKILPPYGNAGMPYIIITTIILASAILIGGIIFIKKKVLR